MVFEFHWLVHAVISPVLSVLTFSAFPFPFTPTHLLFPLSHLYLSALLDKSPRRGHSNPLMRSPQLRTRSQYKSKIRRNLCDLPSHSPSRGSCEQQEIQCCPAERDIDVLRRMDNVVVGLLIELQRHSYLLLSDIITFFFLSQSLFLALCVLNSLSLSISVTSFSSWIYLLDGFIY